MSQTHRLRFRMGLLALALALVSTTGSRPAQAWDPATTQAGLTERALLASSFHRLLAERLGRPLGALEPLALHSQLLPGDLRQTLWNRLAMLDPAGGYRPDADGVNTALGWVTAGAVLAETPPERGRNHFFEPGTGHGLDDAGGLAGTMHALRLSVDAGGSIRDLATGAAFDMTGMPSLRWLMSPQNDLGLQVYENQLALAVGAREPVEREAALTRALLALGGSLAVLEDAGEPAHVRNDFRAAFLERQGPSGWDRGSRFERFVIDHYGRSGVPAPTKPMIVRPNLESFFTSKDGQGLADRTQRRFFSDGTVPEEIPVDATTTPKEVVEAARASLRFALPTITRLELRGPSQRRYLMQEGRRIVAYVREPEGVRFFLDNAIFADSAAALLPEVASYAAGFVDHLLRGSAGFSVEGGNVTVKLDGIRGDKAEGTFTFYAEDEAGRRSPVGTAAARTVASGQEIVTAVPAGTRRVAICFRGQDGGGPLLIVGETAVK